MKSYTNSTSRVAANQGLNERTGAHAQDTHLSNPMVIKSNAASGGNDGQTSLGQENRRPLLQRIFGGSKQQNSNSVGAPVNRAGSSTGGSFLGRGKSHQLVGPQLHSSATTAAETGIGHSNDNSGSHGGLSGLTAPHSIGSRRSNLPGAKVNSVENVKDRDAQSYLNGAKNQAPVSSANGGSRSISRVRQFGKDLTNMFSFNRNASRQSSNQPIPQSSLNINSNKGQRTASQNVPSIPHNNVPSSAAQPTVGGALPKSARHSQQPTQVSFDYVAAAQTKNKALQQERQIKAITGQPKASESQRRNLSQQQNELEKNRGHAATTTQFNNPQRKASLGGGAHTTGHLTTKTGNILQKSLGTLDYKNAISKSGKNSSIKRQTSTSQIRSRDKLPEIGLDTKLGMFQQRVERHINAGISKVDRSTLSNIYHVSEYCSEIQRNMQTEQQLTMAYPFYMKTQNKGFTENLRAEVVNWLFKIHQKYRLWPETLYITVNLMDRYLSNHEIQKEQTYLLAVTCLLIATKYEEIYPPTVKDFIKCTHGKYSREQMIDLEQKILYTLDFQMLTTSSYRFLERYSKVAKADTVVMFLGQFFLELALFDSKMSQYCPALQASAAIYTAMRVIITQANDRPSGSVWTRQLEEHTGYRSSDLKNCSEAYCTLAELILKSNMQEIVEKFRKPEYLEVLRIIKRVFAKNPAQQRRESSQQKGQPRSGESLKQGSSGKASEGQSSQGKASTIGSSSFSRIGRLNGQNEASFQANSASSHQNQLHVPGSATYNKAITQASSADSTKQ